MSDMFADIETWLQSVRRVKTLVDDRYIRDFKAPWHNINKEQGGVVDDYIPEDYARACRKALEGGRRDKGTGHLRKETAWVQVPGSNFSIGRDENGNVTGQGTFSFTPETWAAFMRVAMTMPMGVELPSTQGYGGVSSSAAVSSLKRQDQKNEEAHAEIERIKAFMRR